MRRVVVYMVYICRYDIMALVLPVWCILITQASICNILAVAVYNNTIYSVCIILCHVLLNLFVCLVPYLDQICLVVF